MNWIYKIIFEIIATAIYMFVLFPCWIVLCIFYVTNSISTTFENSNHK